MYSELVQRQGVYNNNQLSIQFFSSQNVDTIQDMIKMKVYKQSNNQYKISRQSDTELFIIMQSIYTQQGRNMNTHVQEQINELNETVANEAVRLIMPRLLQHIGYMNDLDKNIEVLDYGFNTSSYGYKY